MPIRTVECMPMTADVAKPVLDRLALAQFIADGAHLPDGLNTRSDQEDLFRAMHGLTGWNDQDRCASDVTHIEGLSYVFDLFLPFMAQHGYILRKDPDLAGAREMDASIGNFEQLEREARQSLIDGAAARRARAGMVKDEQRAFLDALDATSPSEIK